MCLSEILREEESKTPKGLVEELDISRLSKHIISYHHNYGLRVNKFNFLVYIFALLTEHLPSTMLQNLDTFHFNQI